tara:strand:- start:2041 stop:2679 length:639 start_codon:yes stop_codon:yes gene_type:complete
MDFTEWSKLTLVCILGAMSPGPSLAVILKNSISGGRKQGILSGVGHGFGITFYAFIAVFGLVTFFKKSPDFFIAVQIIGSIFLIWIGVKMIIASNLNINKQINSEIIYFSNPKKGFVEGFLIAFLNPKIAAWTFALFSQFVKPSATINEQIILISTVGGIDALWYCLVAMIATSKGIVNRLSNSSKIIDTTMGIILILLGFGMIWEIHYFFK